MIQGLIWWYYSLNISTGQNAHLKTIVSNLAWYREEEVNLIKKQRKNSWNHVKKQTIIWYRKNSWNYIAQKKLCDITFMSYWTCLFKTFGGFDSKNSQSRGHGRTRWVSITPKEYGSAKLSCKIWSQIPKSKNLTCHGLVNCYLMDGPLLPKNPNHLWWQDKPLCSSLDFTKTF